MVSAVSEQQEERGTFEQISLALLLIRGLDRRWTGTLRVERPTGETELLEFQRGLVCRVIVPDQHARLGQLLVDAKVISSAELESALSSGGLIGAALMEAKLIDEKTLQRALVLQLLKRTSRLFGSPQETKWAFNPSTDLFDGMPEGVRIDTLRVLWAGISAHGEMGSWLQLTLKRIGESPFQVRADVNLRRYGFTGDARRVVRLVRDERVTLNQLVARGKAPEEVVKQIVYLLAITRYLDFAPVGQAEEAAPVSSASGESSVTDEPSISDESTVGDESSTSDAPTSSEDQPAANKPRRVARIKLRRVALRPAAPDPPGSGEHRSPAARSSSEGAAGSPSSERPKDEAAKPEGVPETAATDEQLRAETKSRLARLGRESPFSLLNLSPSDVQNESDDELTDILWSAYEKCSQKWHPDNCPDEMSELREGMAKIYDAMTAAFVRLTESEDRHDLIAAYARKTAGPSELPPTMRSTSSEAPDSESVPRSGESEEPPVEKKNEEEEDESAPDSASGSEAEPPPSGDRPKEPHNLTPTELHAKALVALSEQRLDEALTLCRAACEAEPDNPDYLASSVWIRASMDRPDTKVLLLDLDGVLREHPDHIQARFYRGVLRRRLGSDNAAKRDFERVLELKPSHAGAKAQLETLERGKKKKARRT
jgi:tetratricopeptide (TPR) repeat protein